jgi:hypothetical protein
LSTPTSSAALRELGAEKRAEHVRVEGDCAIEKLFALKTAVAIEPVKAEVEEVEAGWVIDVVGVNEDQPIREASLGAWAERGEVCDGADHVALAVDHDKRAAPMLKLVEIAKNKRLQQLRLAMPTEGVIFRYLARLLMTVPGATIHTLREFMENPEAARPHFEALDGSARHFFETQFASDAFQDTRQQILNRLWGILSSAVLERMFSNERNKVNIFEAMNSGKVILINTAKDLLKHDGSAILGRFFIALITQATQERAAISADKRRATFLYVDEAQDYFDESVGELFNQARKYKVGLIVAHQNLGQFGRELLASVMASTAIKLVGGMSAKDAAAFAREMRCEEEFLQSMRKHAKHTEFACFIRNITPSPLRLTVPFGTMENRPRLSEAEYEELLALNRSRYCASAADQQQTRTRTPVHPIAGFELGRPEVF